MTNKCFNYRLQKIIYLTFFLIYYYNQINIKEDTWSKQIYKKFTSINEKFIF